MCLGIPGEIVEILADREDLAMVSVEGVKRAVNIGLLEDETLVPGDWILIHVGFALSKIDEREAKASLEWLTGVGDAYTDELAALADSCRVAVPNSSTSSRDAGRPARPATRIAALCEPGAIKSSWRCAGPHARIWQARAEDYPPETVAGARSWLPGVRDPDGPVDDAMRSRSTTTSSSRPSATCAARPRRARVVLRLRPRGADIRWSTRRWTR
jgi:hydrogenase expression/formation protein HypC